MTLVKQEFAAFDAAGELICVGPAVVKGIGAGWRTLPADYSDATYKWLPGSRAMVEDAAKVEASLIVKVKAEAETLKMTCLSTGGAKKSEYPEKTGEVRFAASLGGTLNLGLVQVGLMSAERRAVLFPHATADAEEFGDTQQAALLRFDAGITRSKRFPRICAREQKLCADIRAAVGVAAKQAKFAARTWPS